MSRILFGPKDEHIAFSTHAERVEEWKLFHLIIDPLIVESLATTDAVHFTYQAILRLKNNRPRNEQENGR